MYICLIVLMVLCSLALIGVVLIQSGKGNGLSGAFGTGEGQAVFGSRTGDVLTKATEFFAIGFMVLCIAVTIHGKIGEKSLVAGKGSSSKAPSGTKAMLSMEDLEQMQSKTTDVDETQISLSNSVNASKSE